MSAEGNFTSVVSREELDALLASAHADEGHLRVPKRPVGLIEQGGGELAEISRRFGLEQGRSLSTLHQTTIRFHFSHWEEINLRQFASAMVDNDRVATVDLGLGGEDAYFFMNRPLVFSWLLLSFGARPGNDDETLLTRPYTRIEEQLIRRATENISSIFAKTLAGKSAQNARVLSIDDRAALYSRSKRPYRVVSLDVEGLGESSILRIALPSSLLDESPAESSSRMAIQPPNELASQIVDAVVQVRVEVGSAEISLRDLGELSVGDVFTIESPPGDGMLMKIEDSPKFRVEPGKIDNRLAVRIAEVISK